MAVIYIALGTNTGPRVRHIRVALEKLKNDILIERASSLYLTEPVQVKERAWFVNSVVKGRTSMSPRELLDYLLAIEDRMGRVRGEKERRTIDLDILFYGDRVIREDALIVPHPRLHQRRFVLLPLMEISPNLTHPVLGRSIEELFRELQDSHQVERIESGNCC